MTCNVNPHGRGKSMQSPVRGFLLGPALGSSSLSASRGRLPAHQDISTKMPW